MTAVRSLVVVARPEPAPTDSLAEVLRETCTVRTAYSVAEVLDSLDREVDVALVDPALAADAVGAVREAVDDRDLYCQVGLLSTTEGVADAALDVLGNRSGYDAARDGDGDEDADGGGDDDGGADADRSTESPAADAVVSPAVGDRRLRETVEWLAMRARYRAALDEYYELSQASANLEGGVEDADALAELDRLHDQIDRLRTRLDETAERLDTLSLFEVALRERTSE